MITNEYVRTMARYNAWQNNGLISLLESVDASVLTTDRGAFFGSISGTLNHLLWADTIWMSRLDRWPAPKVGIPQSPAFTVSHDAWASERARLDAGIVQWADGLASADLVGDLAWFSGATGREMRRPTSLCVIHMFNHQTHHRGQVHSMLTAAGLEPQMTDLALAPQRALI